MAIGDRYQGREEIDDACQETENVDVFYEVMRNPPAPEGIITVSHMEELKVLVVEIGGIRIEAILDEGSQIITT